MGDLPAPAAALGYLARGWSPVALNALRQRNPIRRGKKSAPAAEGPGARGS